jgi:hypothetical protein
MKPEVLWKMVASAFAVILLAIILSWTAWVSLALVNVPNAQPIWAAIKELRAFHYERHSGD